MYTVDRDGYRVSLPPRRIIAAGIPMLPQSLPSNTSLNAAYVVVFFEYGCFVPLFRRFQLFWPLTQLLESLGQET